MENVIKEWAQFAPQYTDEIAAMSEEEKQFAFGSNLVFGTGGLRGIMQAGTNAMNPYTVKKATMGLAEVILSYGEESSSRGVAISYDTRENSQAFAKICADTLTSFGIPVFLSDTFRPTPVLSFAVRKLGAIAGIMITASHNPKEYNGFKCYWEDGGQLNLEVSEKIIKVMDKQDMWQELDYRPELITYFGEELDRVYIKEVMAQAKHPMQSDLKICYTPLYGCGIEYVPNVLKKAGFTNVALVEEQMRPDGTFPNAPYPNPEGDEAWDGALDIAGDNDADIIIATDPDCDRVACMALHNGQYKRITGNQIGIMLLQFIIDKFQLPDNPFAVVTLVSSRLARKIAESNGIEYFDVYTGFKFIAEKIHELEATHNFVFGFEESIGYLKGDYCRDKDAVVASLLIAQMADMCKKEGITLFDYLADIERKYGKVYEETVVQEFDAVTGAEKLAAVMASLRAGHAKDFGGVAIEKTVDYMTLDVPYDMIELQFTTGALMFVRPSGTEPKVKYYITATTEVELEKIKAAIGEQQRSK